MPIRFSPRFRAPVRALRATLPAGERRLFDLVAAAGELASRWPDDNVNVSMVAGRRDPRRRLAAEGLCGGGPASRPFDRSTSRRLATRLVSTLGAASIDEDARSLRVLLGYAAGGLAPDCRVPRDPARRAAWTTVLDVFDRLFPSSMAVLPAPSFLGARRLAALRREAAAGAAIGRRASGERPGPTGLRLAVDPRLVAEVGGALGRELAPGYQAKLLYYTRAGDYAWPHPDDPKFAVNLLLCIERVAPPRGRGSAFLGFRPNGTVERCELPPGSALAVESTGLVHAREPLAAGERVVLLSILLRDARQAAAC